MKILSTAGLAGAALLIWAQGASAQLIADKLWVDLDSSSANTRQDVILSNESERRYYISVEASEILSPGTPQEVRVQIENPEELGLLVSPNRMVLEPGASRALRIVSINEVLENERIYRVRVTPQVGAIEANPAEGEERGINIVMLTAYDLLITVRPANGQPVIQVERTQDELRLTNIGNTNTLLMDGQACSGAGATMSCIPLEDSRLYAGATASFALPSPEARVQFKARDRNGGRDRELTF
ncbi:MAG: hypothetical protein ACK4MQ_10630 [Hyphomonas sp.]